MFTHIDWLSFTFKFDNSELTNDQEASERVFDEMDYRIDGWLDTLGGGGEWKFAKGRKPYSISLKSQDDGVTLYWNWKLDHFLVEISGKGCERIFANGEGQHVLRAVRGRVTRLDLAVDMECKTNPIDFAKSRSNQRFKSYEEKVSETGTTYYVGAETSNRFARVYRYNEPHPRAHLLRAEHVFRAEDAKAMLESLLDNGLDTAAKQCEMIFGWTHEAWTPDVQEAEKLSAHRASRDVSQTVFWLYETVAPALARLHNEGELDLYTFLKEAVLPKIKTD